MQTKDPENSRAPDDAGLQAFEDILVPTATCVKITQQVGEEAVKTAISETPSPFTLSGDIYYIRNHFTFIITEKI